MTFLGLAHCFKWKRNIFTYSDRLLFFESFLFKKIFLFKKLAKLEKSPFELMHSSCLTKFSLITTENNKINAK
jgi:hypothetical protein